MRCKEVWLSKKTSQSGNVRYFGIAAFHATAALVGIS
jgi:hypothetical protein